MLDGLQNSESLVLVKLHVGEKTTFNLLSDEVGKIVAVWSSVSVDEQPFVVPHRGPPQFTFQWLQCAERLQQQWRIQDFWKEGRDGESVGRGCPPLHRSGSGRGTTPPQKNIEIFLLKLRSLVHSE